MWEYFHKLFGWHYIQFQFGFSNEIRRVRTVNDRRFVKCYGNVFEVMPDGTLDSYHRKYTPLTWRLKEDS